MNPLGTEGLAALQAAVEALDPTHRYVELDVTRQVVSYSPEIIQYETISTYVGEEEPCRALIVAWLCAQGGYLPANIELEKRYSIGRPSSDAELDILVTHPDGTSFALIEVKAPGEYETTPDIFIRGQLFGIAPLEPGCAVLSYATAHLVGREAEIVSMTIDYAVGTTFDSWAEGRAAAALLPVNYGQPEHTHYVKGSGRDLRRDVTHADVEALRKRLHRVLWRGSKPDNLIYEYVVRLFLAKIYDEKTTPDGEPYRFQLLYTGSQRESAAETFKRISDVYLEAFDRYLNVGGHAIGRPFNESDFSQEQIAFVVSLLEGIALTSSDSRNGDLLGGFFEGITRDGFKQSKGLFFTHLNLAAFMLAALDLDGLVREKVLSSSVYSERLPYMIDPSCGSGTFLLAAMKTVTEYLDTHRAELGRVEDVRDFLRVYAPEDHPNLWAKDFVFGIDELELLAMSTKVNMVLHRDGNTHIYNSDGLAPLATYTEQRLKGSPHPHQDVYSKPVASSFDVVISNPPFGVSVSDLVTSGSSFELANEANSEGLFLERWYQLLKPQGRLAAVLPESFFSTKENFGARVFLFDHFDVRAVVSLPKHAFEPWTPTRTSLLFAQRKKPEDEAVWVRTRKNFEATARQLQQNAKAAARLLRRDLEAVTGSVWLEQLQDLAAKSTALGVPPAVDPAAEYFALSAGPLLAWAGDIRTVAPKTPEEKALAKTTLQLIRTLAKRVQKSADAIALVDECLAHFGHAADTIAASSEPRNRAIDRATAIVPSLDSVHLSFGKTADAIGGGFRLAGAENIGYKRTKRREYDRPNDLFTATSGPGTTRILNLNLHGGDWFLSVDPSDPHDLLSSLRGEIKWQ